MAIGINDLDDDDFGSGLERQEPSTEEEIQNPPASLPSDLEDEFISDFLKSRGIDDPSKIKFEDDNNQLIERDWKDLSKEEKINILNIPLETEDNSNGVDLTEEEIALLNEIRKNNMTPSEYILLLSTEENVQEPHYSIDDLSDDEIYLLDLESRVGELTDEQAALALNIAKSQDEELYKKLVEGIRKEYKEKEDFKNLLTQALLEQELLEAYQQYQEQIVNAINDLTSIGNLDLNFEDSDKEILAEFMLSQDESGANYLYQALLDPETLTKAAWFILNGEEAFNSITDYFTKLIKLVSENQYKKGLEDGKKGVSQQTSKPTVVINKNNNNTRHQYDTIYNLDDDDE